MESFVKVKALNDFYDDVHCRRQGSGDTTLCGLKTAGRPVEREVTCLRCREFAAGNF